MRLQPGVKTIVVDVDDSDDESTDFSDFLVVKDDPYLTEGEVDIIPMKEETAPCASMASAVSPEKVVDAIQIIDDTPVKAEDEPVDATEASKASAVEPPKSVLAKEDRDAKIYRLRLFGNQFSHVF